MCNVKKIAKSPIKKNKNFRIENPHNRGSTIFNINIDTYSSRLLYYKRTNINPQFFSTIHFKTIIHHTESKKIFHTTISSLNKLTGPTSRFENTPARAKSKIQLQNRKKNHQPIKINLNPTQSLALTCRGALWRRIAYGRRDSRTHISGDLCRRFA